MIWSLSRKSSSEKLQEQAKSDYELATDPDRSNRSFRVKIALRCRANIDRAFISSAKSAESASQDSEENTELEASPYQLVRSGEGYIYTYIREEHAETIFQLGRDYQEGLIDTYGAINKAQAVADQICQELDLPDSFQTLSFLLDDEEAVASGEQDND